ncbi:MAG: hypothetical protein ACN4A7_06095 [Thermacetogeniaceae bacterium]|nr:hypothetical protein [Thermoanaerobacterales bacterium]NLN21977.1 hypothetical protein [Syntrophomonadaceae bacterium]
MSYKDLHNLYEKAIEYDLEEIGLLTMAARKAPPPVRQALLGMIKGEAQGAEFWNTLYACTGDYSRPCHPDDRKRPPGYYPLQKSDEDEKND